MDFVDGLRNGKTYAEIRKDMEKDPLYKSRTENVFVMPDEQLYKDQLISRLRIPIAVDTKITESAKSGESRPYSIEEN